jgi:hypothetical protein
MSKSTSNSQFAVAVGVGVISNISTGHVLFVSVK